MFQNQLLLSGRLYWAPVRHGNPVDAKLAQSKGHTNTKTGVWVKESPFLIRLEAVGKAAEELSALKKGQMVRIEGRIDAYSTGINYVRVRHASDATVVPLDKALA